MHYKFILPTLLLVIVSFGQLLGQSMDKKYYTLVVERQINAPASQVWEALVLDYGKIANFSPFIYASNYENGSLAGKEGAERKCLFNAKGSRWSHERIKEIDSENMTMTNIIIDAAKFPLDLDNSYAQYYVIDNGDGTTTAGYEFNFRTKPSFMGGIAKGSFRKSLNETLIGLGHYLQTGERVTGGSETAKEVIKQYKKDGRYQDYRQVRSPQPAVK